MMTYGRLINYIREQVFHLSLLDFAILIDTTHTTVHRWENDRFGVRFDKNPELHMRFILTKIVAALYTGMTINRKSMQLSIDQETSRKSGLIQRFRAQLAAQLDTHFPQHPAIDQILQASLENQELLLDIACAITAAVVDANQWQLNQLFLKKESERPVSTPVKSIPDEPGNTVYFPELCNLLALDKGHTVTMNDFIHALASKKPVRCLISGIPGIGKSALLNYLSEIKGPQAILAQLYSYRNFNQILTEWQPDPGTLLLLDGLDELILNSEDVSSLKIYTDFLIQALESGYPILVTLRANLFDSVSHHPTIAKTFQTYELSPLTDQQMTFYLNQQRIQDIPTEPVFHTPFYANLIIRTQQVSGAQFDQYTLIEQYLEMEIETFCAKSGLQKSRYTDFLLQIAFVMREQGLFYIQPFVLNHIFNEYFPDHMFIPPAFLYKHTIGYRFFHNLILEFLTARKIYIEMAFRNNLDAYGIFPTTHIEDYLLACATRENVPYLKKLLEIGKNHPNAILAANVLGLLGFTRYFPLDMILDELIKRPECLMVYYLASLKRLGVRLHLEDGKIFLDNLEEDTPAMISEILHNTCMPAGFFCLVFLRFSPEFPALCASFTKKYGFDPTLQIQDSLVIIGT